jgi:acetyl-CoA acetyltransferase
MAVAFTKKPFDRAKVAVLGIGYSKISRVGLPDGTVLGDECLEACRVAIEDAGLCSEDIDGITSFVGPNNDEAADGIACVSPEYIWRRMRLAVRWGEVNQKFVGSSLIEAHNAVASGACRYALVLRAVNTAEGGGLSAPAALLATDDAQFTLPYGAGGYSIAHALVAQRYYKKYGATRQHMANFVVANRRHALMNEKSYWSLNRPEALSVDKYLSARMIAEPLCLYDCDIPVRGCVAYVLGPADAGRDLSHRPAFIKAFAQAWVGPRGRRTFYHEGGRLSRPSLEDNEGLPSLYERNLWGPSGLRPSDMSTVNLYDGFSIFVWLWLEALGFCNVGEGFEFVQNGRVELGGDLPLNTGGGHLGEGALAGAPHYSEAILQAMGRAGVRQVENVRFSLAGTDRPTRGQVIIFGAEP